LAVLLLKVTAFAGLALPMQEDNDSNHEMISKKKNGAENVFLLFFILVLCLAIHLSNREPVAACVLENFPHIFSDGLSRK
jgi:hypothetical protein